MFGFIKRFDKVIWPPLRDSSADVSSVSPKSERILITRDARKADRVKNSVQIEPELKPVPPQRGYFCALLFQLSSTIIFCDYIRREGTESFYQSDLNTSCFIRTL